MSDQTEYEIEEAIAEEGTNLTWSDLSPNARRIVQKELAAQRKSTSATPSSGSTASATPKDPE